MILLVNICNEKLHEFEFVKPIEDLFKREGKEFFTKKYTTVNDDDLAKADKVIICGTSLRDVDFLENVGKFKWISDFKKPLLGICGGMEIIGNVYENDLVKKKEIGFHFVNFKKEFLGFKGELEVYQLHNLSCDFDGGDFDVYAVSENGICQAVKHKKKNVYGVLFHPEVRNKEMILNFIS